MAVNNANVSVNLDRPEGSLDAMAQVISCSEVSCTYIRTYINAYYMCSLKFTSL